MHHTLRVTIIPRRLSLDRIQVLDRLMHESVQHLRPHKFADRQLPLPILPPRTPQSAARR